MLLVVVPALMILGRKAASGEPSAPTAEHA
jgi:hypothetical protein